MARFEQIQQISFGGWDNCWQMRGGGFELIITAAVGPRVVWFGLEGGRNELALCEDQLGMKGGEDFRLYGGHRLWVAPEEPDHTYYPDNHEVEVEHNPVKMVFRAPIERPRAIQKTLAIQLVSGGMRLVHGITNLSKETIRIAPWAVTMLAPGGIAMLPLTRVPQQMRLQPVNTLALWDYTHLDDARLRFHSDWLEIQQDPSNPSPLKLGLRESSGCAEYYRDGWMFVKEFPYSAKGIYPDMGCSVEVYVAANYLELESFAALRHLAPGKSVEHTETWRISRADNLDAAHSASNE